MLTRLVVRMAVDASVRAMNNNQLLQWVSGELPGYKPVSGLLDKALSTKQIKAIDKSLVEMGRPALPTGIRCSPSKIKMALRARDKGNDLSARTYRPTIVITDSTVIVDNHSHARLEKAKRIKIGGAKLSVEAFEKFISR